MEDRVREAEADKARHRAFADRQAGIIREQIDENTALGQENATLRDRVAVMGNEADGMRATLAMHRDGDHGGLIADNERLRDVIRDLTVKALGAEVNGPDEMAAAQTWARAILTVTGGGGVDDELLAALADEVTRFSQDNRAKTEALDEAYATIETLEGERDALLHDQGGQAVATIVDGYRARTEQAEAAAAALADERDQAVEHSEYRKQAEQRERDSRTKAQAGHEERTRALADEIAALTHRTEIAEERAGTLELAHDLQLRLGHARTEDIRYLKGLVETYAADLLAARLDRQTPIEPAGDTSGRVAYASGGSGPDRHGAVIVDTTGGRTPPYLFASDRVASFIYDSGRVDAVEWDGTRFDVEHWDDALLIACQQCTTVVPIEQTNDTIRLLATLTGWTAHPTLCPVCSNRAGR